jgi:hypothetical protein
MMAKGKALENAGLLMKSPVKSQHENFTYPYHKSSLQSFNKKKLQPPNKEASSLY